MNIQLLTHEGYTDRFEQRATQIQDHGDFGVRLTLPGVKTFEKDDMGRIHVSFADGADRSVPYGQVKRAYDEGV